MNRTRSEKSLPKITRHNITNDEAQFRLEEFKQSLEKSKEVELNGVPVFYDDAMLLRFLRARNFDVSKSLQMAVKFYKWWKETKIEDIQINDFKSELEKQLYYILGMDPAGRLTMLVYPRKFDPKNRNTAEFVKMFLYTMVAIEKVQSPVEQVNVIVDLEGFKPQKNLDYELLKIMLDIFQNYWPERLNLAVVINAPKLYDVVWKLVKKLLDQETKKKVIFSSTKELHQTFPRKLLPPQYEGELSKAELEGWFKRIYGEQASLKDSLDPRMFERTPQILTPN